MDPFVDRLMTAADDDADVRCGWMRDSSAGPWRGITEPADPARGRHGRHILQGDGHADADPHVVQGRP